MATVQSLVESGSFIIDETAFIHTGDKVYINNHFYSDKPPIPSVFGAIAYFPLYHMGVRLHEGKSIAYYVVTLLTIKLFWVLGIIAFFYALRFTGLDAEKRLAMSLAFGIGSIYFSWSSTFNNNVLAASFISIAYLFHLKALNEETVNRNLGIAGFFFLIAATSDYPTGIFYFLFLLSILRSSSLRSGVVFYILPIFITILPALAMNYCIHESVMPVQIVRSYFEYPGSPWIGSDHLSGMQVNKVGYFAVYLLGILIGPRGFLLYNPLLFIALWGVFMTIRSRGPFYNEAVVVSFGSAVLVIYYALVTVNYSGLSYSIRWFVPLLPLLLFFLYPYFERYTEMRRCLFQVLFLIAITASVIGVINPWTPRSISEVPIVANIKEFVNGNTPGK